MNSKLVYVILFLVFVSCNYNEPFATKKSERVLVRDTIVTICNDSKIKPYKTVFTFVNKFYLQDSSFNLQEFEAQYNSFYRNTNPTYYHRNALPAWIEINGLLLELTGKEKYARELEKISVNDSITGYIAPFVLTKSVDDIFVNLFEPAELSYKHSLGGEVTFRQETSFPESGSVRLHFEMTERRYIELFIRIPEWAEGTSVVVKGVKYLTKPGNYCYIAKKWKEGDLVEIELPIEKYPDRLP